MQTTSVDAPAMAVDWRAAAAEFRPREFGVLRQAAVAIPGAHAAELSGLFDPTVSDRVWRTNYDRTLRAAFAAAAAVPGGLSILAAYLYGLCQKRWEHSLDHSAILRVANAAAAIFADTSPDDETDDRRLARLLLDLGVSLASCMAAENALNCSCPVDMRRHAAAAAEVGQRVIEECTLHCSREHTDAYDFVVQVASAQAVYFGALERVAHAVETFIDQRHDSAETLQAAIALVHQAEAASALRDDVYESELRSHRVTLETMTGLIDVPALQVEDGRILYCYPFAVLGLSSEDVTTRLLRLPRGSRLGRATVVDVGDLDVTDAWDNSDPEGRSYGGIEVTLADLTITTTAGITLPPHQVQVCATNIGTCYVRVAAQLRDVSAHGLNQAMRRGSVHMGLERICQDTDRWGQLSDYAAELIAAVETLLARDDESVRIVASVQRRQHTVLSIRKLAMVSSSGVTRSAHYDDIQAALGARLFDQRINHASATLEEYVRIPQRDAGTVIRDVAFEGEVIVRNAESTIIVMPTTPNFVMMYYEDMAEFSACLPVLLDKWTTAIFEQRRDLRAQMPRLDAVWSDRRLDRRTAQALAKEIRDLERRQAALQEAVSDAQSMLGFVRSSAICQSAKYREILDSLFEAADVPRLERDLDLQIDKVDALHLRVQTLAQRLDEREQRRYRLLVEVTLAFLAVTSLADFFALLNSAFDNRLIFLEVGVVLMIGLLVAVIAVRSAGRRNHV